MNDPITIGNVTMLAKEWLADRTIQELIRLSAGKK